MKLHTVHYQRRDGDHPFGHSSCWYKFEAITVALRLFLAWPGRDHETSDKLFNFAQPKRKEGMADNEPVFQRECDWHVVCYNMFEFEFSGVKKNYSTIHSIL